MKVLDLFCGGMGASWGYVQAGSSVVGVDIHRRRDLPDSSHISFIKGDALSYASDLEFIRSFDLIHASPPCQTHSRTKHLRDAQGKSTSKTDLIAPTRALLDRAGVPYVIENVPGAPLRADILLCGSMFPELHVHDNTGRRWLQRHRIFECSFPVPLQPPCDHKGAGVRPLGVYASKADDIPSGGQTCRTLEQARQLMGIPWMSWAAIIEAIPPAYTRFLATKFLEQT